MLRIPLRTLLIGTALLILPAAAQTSVAASLLAGIISIDEQLTPEPRRPDTTIPEKIQPQENGTTGSGEHNESLSDKLDRSDGVLRPPADVDPGLAKPAPDVGTTRIIPAGLARGRSDGEAKVILAGVGTEHFRTQNRAPGHVRSLKVG
jgi:hypothetical protein